MIYFYDFSVRTLHFLIAAVDGGGVSFWLLTTGLPFSEIYVEFSLLDLMCLCRIYTLDKPQVAIANSKEMDRVDRVFDLVCVVLKALAACSENYYQQLMHP